MIDIDSWLKLFTERAEQNFPGRLHFLGLQGSYARGEAKDTSDIDIVVILDKFTADDLQKYRLMLDTLPEREKICGFVSGLDEILNWEPSDLFQFCYDTVPIIGNLDELFALIDTASVKRTVKIGACNIYHACVHNFLHEMDANILASLYKSAAFVIQAMYFLRTGHYVRKHSELSGLVTPDERRILTHKISEFDTSSRELFDWAGRTLHDEA